MENRRSRDENGRSALLRVGRDGLEALGARVPTPNLRTVQTARVLSGWWDWLCGGALFCKRAWAFCAVAWCGIGSGRVRVCAPSRSFSQSIGRAKMETAGGSPDPALPFKCPKHLKGSAPSYIGPTTHVGTVRLNDTQVRDGHAWAQGFEAVSSKMCERPRHILISRTVVLDACQSASKPPSRDGSKHRRERP